MTEAEADVIEAAVEWAENQYGAQFGPMPKHVLDQSHNALMEACSNLAAECEGKWRRPE